MVGSKNGAQLCWAVPLQTALSPHPAMKTMWSFLESLHSLPLGTFPQFLRNILFCHFWLLGIKKNV